MGCLSLLMRHVRRLVVNTLIRLLSVRHIVTIETLLHAKLTLTHLLKLTSNEPFYIFEHGFSL